MPKSRIIFKSPSHMRKVDEKCERESIRPWQGMGIRTCVIFVVFGLLLSLCGPVGAYYFPPVPSKHIIIDETAISVSLTSSAKTVFINVSQYDAKQIVKNITLDFREPVTFISFILKGLSKRPSYVDPLDNSTNLKYYAITFSTGVNDEIANVKIDFAIQKDAAQKTNFSEETLVLYRFDGENMQECPTAKVAEDDAFVYFKTSTEGSSYVVATGGISSPWFAVAIIVAAVALVAVTLICGYRRAKLAGLKKMLGIGHGK
jgi:PGF-pre-PGF domain-containing protein